MTAQQVFATDVDVLVVGAGPTGLFLAAELLRQRCSVLLVDKAALPSSLSKAVIVHPRTLEILDAVGLADDLITRGTIVRGVSAFSDGEPWLDAELEDLETRFPYLLSVAQAETEGVLLKWLERLGGRVEWGVELVALTDGEATLDSSSGRTSVRAKWIVGCDGAHSTVRTLAAIPFAGKSFDEAFLLGDFGVEWDAPEDRALVYTGQSGVVAFFPMRSKRWRLVAAVDAALAPGHEAPSLELFQAITDRLTRNRARLGDPTWTSRLQVHSRQASSYRSGRVWLAGDAAHVQSPAGGQGLNTGLQDAHNLAYKLALACRGAASLALLDSYHAERHPVGARVLADTNLLTRLGALRSSFARALRDRLTRLLAGVPSIEHRVLVHLAELDVGYLLSPIVGEARGSVLNARLIDVGDHTSAQPHAADASGPRSLEGVTAEPPSLAGWRAFDSGPRPGTFAPDGPVARDSREGAGPPSKSSEPLASTTTLHRMLDTRKHTVLAFAGDGDDAKTASALLGPLARTLVARYPGLVDVLFVTRPPEPDEVGSDLEDGVRVAFDPAGVLSSRYGARSACLYLVRPDLYVGFRSQPLQPSELMAHLDALFREAEPLPSGSRTPS